MIRDKNSDKRYEYEIKIMDKEREMDEIHLQQRQAEREIENFSTSMTQMFCQFQEIEEEIKQRSEISNTFSETEEKRKYITNFLAQSQEEMALRYRRQYQQMEEEREQLHRERGALSWD